MPANMAQLQRLSQEIYREIIEYALLRVIETDFTLDKWELCCFLNLRLVNSAFDDEVLKAIDCEIRRLSHYQRDQRPPLTQISLFAPFAAKMLQRQMSKQLEKPHDTHLLHMIIDKLGIGTDEPDQLEVLEILFRETNDCLRLSVPVYDSYSFTAFLNPTIITLSWMPPVEERELGRHLVSAAILLQKSTYYGSIFDPLMEANELTRDREFFGTPLYAANKSRQNDLAIQILDSIKRIGLKGIRNCWHAATVADDVTMLQYLLQHAGPVLKDRRLSLREALIEAARSGRVTIARFLFKYSQETLPEVIDSDLLSESVFYPSLYGHISYLDFLVQKGADLETAPKSDVSRATPLMVAAWKGDTELLHWLISRRSADQSWESHRPVAAAIDSDQVESLRVLRKAGALDKILCKDWHDMIFL